MNSDNNQSSANAPQEDKPKNTNGTADDIPPVFVTIPQQQLETLEHDLEEAKDKYLRLLAESENMRKRMQKERQELIQFAVQNVIVEFLDPIDNLERALSYTQQLSEELKQWAFGFQMILNQLKEVLNRHGVVAFKSKGTPFDPHHHEALETITTSEVPHGIVIEELSQGYRIGDRTIRPARVKVAKAPEKSSGVSSNGTGPNQECKKD